MGKGLLCVFCCFPRFLLPTPHSAVTFPPESKLINVTFSSLFLLWVMRPPPVPSAAALASATTAVALSPMLSKIPSLSPNQSLNQHRVLSAYCVPGSLPGVWVRTKKGSPGPPSSLSASSLQSRSGAGTGTLKSLINHARVNQPCKQRREVPGLIAQRGTWRVRA